MSGTSTIAAIVLVVGTSATIGVAHKSGWGAFGEFEQVLTQVDTCKPQVLSIGWSTGAGSRPIAETRALISWSKKARRHGNHYSSWHNARSRDVTCKPLSRNGTKCTIKGRPCMQKAQIDLVSELF